MQEVTGSIPVSPIFDQQSPIGSFFMPSDFLGGASDTANQFHGEGNHESHLP